MNSGHCAPDRPGKGRRPPPGRYAVKLRMSSILNGTFVLMARKNKGQSAPELSALPGAFSSSFRVSANALDVIRRIKKTGRCAFIVGGAVRDALTGGAPADFDIATESWPSFVVKAVPGSRTQGRRFIIVVRDFGRETVEITTFRRESARRERFGSNRYGSLMDDAMARDFTINALYLDPFAGVILDPLDGLRDLADRTVRLIGDPKERFGNDSVRLLRAVRFASVPGYHLDEGTRKGIVRYAGLLRLVNHRRLTAELIRLFDKNESRQLELFSELGLMDAVIAGMNEVRKSVNPSEVSAFLRRAGMLSETLHECGASVDGCTAFAVLLWLPALAAVKRVAVEGKISGEGIRKCLFGVMRSQQAFSLIPQTDALRIHDALAKQFVSSPERASSGPEARSFLFLWAARKGELSGVDPSRLAGLFKKRMNDGFDHNSHSVSALPDELLSEVTVRSVCTGPRCEQTAADLRKMPEFPEPPAEEQGGAHHYDSPADSAPAAAGKPASRTTSDVPVRDTWAEDAEERVLPSGYALYIKGGSVTKCPQFIGQAVRKITLKGRAPQGGGFFRRFTLRQIRRMLGEPLAASLAGDEGIAGILAGYSSEDIHFYPDPHRTGIIALMGPDVRAEIYAAGLAVPASGAEILRTVRRLHPGFVPEKAFGSVSDWLRCSFFTEKDGLWRPSAAEDCFLINKRNLGARVSEMITMEFTFPVRTWEGASRIVKRLRLGSDPAEVLSGLASPSLRPDITCEGVVLVRNDGTAAQAEAAARRIREFAAKAAADAHDGAEGEEDSGE